MSKKLIARTAKLLSETKKGRRFKGIAITYEHIPSDLEERNHGSIYAVININTAKQEAEDIAELIIDTLHGEFYQNLHEAPLASFESALSRINEELAEATHQGSIGWLNNLNAIIGVLTNNVLHISQAGKTEAYLYRGDRASHISDELAGDAVNPLRTFINIASGELVEGDKVSIVTPSVFYHVSKDELKKYVKEFQPKVAISHIADLLEGTSSEMNPNAVLILEAITPEAASNETLDQQPEEIWISEPSKPVEDAIETATPFVKKAVKAIAAGWAWLKIFSQGTVVPFIIDTAGKAKDVYSNLRSGKPRKTGGSRILTTTDESLRMDEEEMDYKSEVDNGSLEKSSEIIETPIDKKPRKNEIFIKESSNKPKWLKLEKVDFSAAKKFGIKAKDFGQKYTGNRKGLIVVAVAILLVLAGTTYFNWNGKKTENDIKQARATLNEARSKYEIGNNEVASGRKSQGANDLNEAKSLAESLKNNKTVGSEAAALLSEIDKALDIALSIVRPQVSEISKVEELVGKNPFGPYPVGENLFFINPESGQIASVNTKNNEASTVLTSGSVDGRVLAATVVPTRSVLVFISDQGLIYEFDTVDNKLNEQNTAGEIERPVAMSVFSTNIYTLTGDGMVYKRVKVAGGYGKRVEYIKDSNYLANSVDIAIDSNVYVLSSGGTINQYLVGKLQTFSLNDLSFEIDKAKAIFTNEDTNGLFIATGDKVVRFDAKGKFLSQFVSGNFTEIGGIAVDDETNTIYVSSAGTVYKFNF